VPLDRPLLAFFALAYGIAWAVFGAAAWTADAAGLSGPVELIARAEALDFTGIREDLPVPTWVVYLGTRVADFAFTLAALIVIGATEGRAGLAALGRRLLPTRRALRWTGLGLLPMLFYGVATALAARQADSIEIRLSAATFGAVLFSAHAGILFHFFLRGALGEEPGLRGFALVRLQPRVGEVRASLVIGVLWALWHLPVLIGRDPVQIVFFSLLAVLLSFAMTWLFNGGGGCLIPPMLFHAVQNSEEAFETVFPFLYGASWETPSALLLLLFCAGVTAHLVRRARRADR
jgi:membrane protease YdiL (CAAX protease family)